MYSLKQVVTTSCCIFVCNCTSLVNIDLLYIENNVITHTIAVEMPSSDYVISAVVVVKKSTVE